MTAFRIGKGKPYFMWQVIDPHNSENKHLIFSFY